CRAIEHPPVRVAGVTVRAAERAPHVRIDRPKAHLGRFRVVQNGPSGAAEVLNVLLLANHRQRPPERSGVKERRLLNLGAWSDSHRHLDLRDWSHTLPNKLRRFKLGISAKKGLTPIQRSGSDPILGD